MTAWNKLIYSLPLADGVFAQLNGDHIYPKLDLSEAYKLILVDVKCAEILTINTQKRLYKFLRLSLGIKVAPTIFQQVMDTMLSGLDFAIAYLDDIIMKSKIREEQAKYVKEVLKK